MEDKLEVGVISNDLSSLEIGDVVKCTKSLVAWDVESDATNAVGLDVFFNDFQLLFTEEEKNGYTWMTVWKVS